MPTKIEWTDETWNPVTGCTPVSEGCAHCYAARMAKRLAGRCGYPESPHEFDVTLHPDRLGEPLHWRKPRRVFVCSMGDLFHEDVPFEYILKVFYQIGTADRHIYQVLTKRPGRMMEFFEFWHSCNETAREWNVPYFKPPLRNVWLGVTAENQRRANERIPLLLQTPAAMRFVSVEPCLGDVDLVSYLPWCKKCSHPTNEAACDWCCENPDDKAYLDWVICGGETSPGARPMHLTWARSLRDQCQEAGVAFFFKKWGGWMPSPYPILLDEDEDVPGIQIIDDEIMINIVNTNTKYNHQLDGREWNEYPEVK